MYFGMTAGMYLLVMAVSSFGLYFYVADEKQRGKFDFGLAFASIGFSLIWPILWPIIFLQVIWNFLFKKK